MSMKSQSQIIAHIKLFISSSLFFQDIRHWDNIFKRRLWHYAVILLSLTTYGHSKTLIRFDENCLSFSYMSFQNEYWRRNFTACPYSKDISGVSSHYLKWYTKLGKEHVKLLSHTSRIWSVNFHICNSHQNKWICIPWNKMVTDVSLIWPRV